MTAKPTIVPNTGAIAAAVTRSKLRERIEQAKQAAAIKRRERVDIEEYGLSFYMHPVPIGVRMDLFNMAAAGSTTSTTEYLMRMVHESAHDEDGVRVWGPEEYEEVRALPPEMFLPLSQGAQKVNATTEAAWEQVGNDSEPTPKNDSSTASPEKSEA